MKKFFHICMVFSALIFNNNAHAMIVACPGCSNIWTQLIEKATSLQQYAENIKHTINQVTMIQREVEQYQNMIKNTEGLSMDSLTDVKGLLNGLATSGSRLEVMRADTNAMQKMFTDLYPDFQDLTGFGEEEEKALDNMSKQVDKATLATFQATGAQLEEMKESGTFDNHVDDLLATPEGQMQALSSANHLSSLQLKESRLLRETILTQVQAEATVRARAEKEKQMQTAIERAFYDTPDLKLESYEDPF